MTRYRKKPIEVEAIQYTGNNEREIADFMQLPVIALRTSIDCVLRADGDYRENSHIHIHTLEGTMTANYGDYIIKGVKGEFYPCKSDIFDETYEVVKGKGITEKAEKVAESQIDFLKPCPFCDNADNDMLSVFDDKDYIEKHRWYVYCHKCGAQGPRAGSEKDAIDRWNKEVKE